MVPKDPERLLPKKTTGGGTVMKAHYNEGTYSVNSLTNILEYLCKHWSDSHRGFVFAFELKQEVNIKAALWAAKNKKKKKKNRQKKK